MIYLIDNQLPVGLARHLQGKGLDSVHVFECGLDRAKDSEIWDYAKTNGCVIVSKDEDFFHLSGSDPTGPPLVWVRLGTAIAVTPLFSPLLIGCSLSYCKQLMQEPKL